MRAAVLACVVMGAGACAEPDLRVEFIEAAPAGGLAGGWANNISTSRAPAGFVVANGYVHDGRCSGNVYGEPAWDYAQVWCRFVSAEIQPDGSVWLPEHFCTYSPGVLTCDGILAGPTNTFRPTPDEMFHAEIPELGTLAGWARTHRFDAEPAWD